MQPQQPDDQKLIPGHRYFFYCQTDIAEEYLCFRANFEGIEHYTNHLGITYSVMILKDYHNSDWLNSHADVWYMDLNCVQTVETLADILNGQTKLTDDVLHLIDSYL